MSIKDELKSLIEDEENRTVRDSFGGTKLPGNRAPSFSVSSIRIGLLALFRRYPHDPLTISISDIKNKLNEQSFS